MNNGPSKGLSTGAKAGIGVGVPIAVLVVALLSWGIYKWRKDKSKAADKGKEKHTLSMQRLGRWVRPGQNADEFVVPEDTTVNEGH